MQPPPPHKERWDSKPEPKLNLACQNKAARSMRKPSWGPAFNQLKYGVVYIELSITGLGSYLGAGKDRVVVRAGLELDSYEGGEGGDIIWSRAGHNWAGQLSRGRKGQGAHGGEGWPRIR